MKVLIFQETKFEWDLSIVFIFNRHQSRGLGLFRESNFCLCVCLCVCVCVSLVRHLNYRRMRRMKILLQPGQRAYREEESPQGLGPYTGTR